MYPLKCLNLLRVRITTIHTILESVLYLICTWKSCVNEYHPISQGWTNSLKYKGTKLTLLEVEWGSRIQMRHFPGIDGTVFKIHWKFASSCQSVNNRHNNASHCLKKVLQEVEIRETVFLKGLYINKAFLIIKSVQSICCQSVVSTISLFLSHFTRFTQR